jgi:hypothetical protein
VSNEGIGRFGGFFDTLDTAGYSLTVVGPFEVAPDEEKGPGVAETASWANPDVAAVC